MEKEGARDREREREGERGASIACSPKRCALLLRYLVPPVPVPRSILQQ